MSFPVRPLSLLTLCALVAVPLAAGTSISDLFTGGGMGGGTRQGQAETTKAPDETSGG